jgi:Ni,Fe-hydrogenase III large subunit
MEIVYFILGVFSVVTLIAVGITFKIRQEIKDLKNQKEVEYSDLGDEIWNSLERFDRRIDQEIDRSNKLVEDLYKYADSRTDKMESRLDSKFNESYKNIDLMQHAIEKLQHQTAEVQVSLENELNKNNK